MTEGRKVNIQDKCSSVHHFITMITEILAEKSRDPAHNRFAFPSLFIALTILFALVSLPGGDDWTTFSGAVRRLFTGESLYVDKITFAYYSNPPWLAVLLIPFGLLPFRLGLAAMSAGSVCACLGLSLRWKLGFWKLPLLLISPPFLYTMLHGEVDVVLLAAVLLPAELWTLTALTKPQVTCGLIFGIPRNKIGVTLVVTLVTVGVSLLIFRDWPIQIIQQPKPFIDAGHNIWRGIWPYQVPIGVVLILIGYRRKNQSFLLAASPFFAPYAATSSLMGPWFAVCTILRDWELAIVWIVWWGAILYRGVGGWT